MAEDLEINEEDLPRDIKDWSKSQVREWALKQKGVNVSTADLLFQEEICGSSLFLLDKSDLTEKGVKLGPALSLIHARDKLIKLKRVEPTLSTTKPYPFGEYHQAFRYVEGRILSVPESGPLNLTEPCHEFKGFYKTPEEKKLEKFTNEVMRFAPACMNCRTNGTMHFGIGDKPNFKHGQVVGVVVDDQEKYINALKSIIDKTFEHKHKDAAHWCIKPPRFVEVLNRNATSSGKYVIEVDIEPQSVICGENYYHTYITNQTKKKTKDKCFYIRDGGSTRDLLAPTTFSKTTLEYEQFVMEIPQLSQYRENAEKKHSEKTTKRRKTTQDLLMNRITRGILPLDKSHFEHYVIVTNKSHPSHFKHLRFLIELEPTAVLDFDPESAVHGLRSYFDQQTTVSSHLPANYKTTESVKETADKLGLFKNTSWVFCNGGIEQEEPSDIDQWSMDKGATVRDMISFLCDRDVLPNKRFLVIFLLFSTVREITDPLVETFSMFLQELGGYSQILCICDNENTFTSCKDLIDVDVKSTSLTDASISSVLLK